MTKDALTAETRQLLSHLGCQASDYAGHSYRIGAATAAPSSGLPPWLVKTLGRWPSDCYERYIQCPQPVLSGVALKLLQNTQVSYCLHCLHGVVLIKPTYLLVCNCARLLFHTKFLLFSALHSI